MCSADAGLGIQPFAVEVVIASVKQEVGAARGDGGPHQYTMMAKETQEARRECQMVPVVDVRVRLFCRPDHAAENFKCQPC